MAETAQLVSIDDSPRGLRDHYGFEISKDHATLHSIYTPLWEQDEGEREAHWTAFLMENAHLTTAESGKFPSLADFGLEYLQDAFTIAQSEAPGSQLRNKLEELVHGGIPFQLRGQAWTIFLDTQVRKQKNYYTDLVERCLGELKNRRILELEDIRTYTAAAAAAHSGHDHEVHGPGGMTTEALDAWHANSKVWLTQIEKDLPRTFPGLPLMDESGRPALRRILAAYSMHNPDVGYCQGMNFVAGTLLLFMDEEDAFYCLCTLAEDILAGYYTVDMMATQVDQRVFKRLVSEHFPQLVSHLDGLGADVSCVFVQWFLCVFVNFLPMEVCLRVWDSLFYYRSSTVLFKTALALLQVYGEALAASADVLDALDLIQSLARMTFDGGRLMAVAAGPSLEGITDQRLATLRTEYRQELAAEMEAMEAEAADRFDIPLMAMGGAGLAASAAAAANPPPLQPRVSMVKKLLQKLENNFDKLTGGASATAAAGSGTNSVERAASPAPGGATAAPLPVTALAGGGGGGPDEPLLLRSSQAVTDVADSEDYLVHPLVAPAGEEPFQFEQVGYVGPSGLSETNSVASAGPLGGHLGDERQPGGNGVLVPPPAQGAGAAGTPSAPVRPAGQGPSAAASSSAAVPPRPLPPPPPAALTVPPEGAFSAVSVPVLSPAAGPHGGAEPEEDLSLLPTTSASVVVNSPSTSWHLKPKWISLRGTHSALLSHPLSPDAVAALRHGSSLSGGPPALAESAASISSASAAARHLAPAALLQQLAVQHRPQAEAPASRPQPGAAAAAAAPLDELLQEALAPGPAAAAAAAVAAAAPAPTVHEGHTAPGSTPAAAASFRSGTSVTATASAIPNLLDDDQLPLQPAPPLQPARAVEGAHLEPKLQPSMAAAPPQPSQKRRVSRAAMLAWQVASTPYLIEQQQRRLLQVPAQLPGTPLRGSASGMPPTPPPAPLFPLGSGGSSGLLLQPTAPVTIPSLAGGQGGSGGGAGARPGSASAHGPGRGSAHAGALPGSSAGAADGVRRMGSTGVSVGSVCLLDEHREASPAEAKDEWVNIVIPKNGQPVGNSPSSNAAAPSSSAAVGAPGAPGGQPQRPPSRTGQQGTPATPLADAICVPSPEAEASTQGRCTPGRARGSSGGGSSSAGGACPGGGALSPSAWPLKVDERTVSELKEQLGVVEMLQHHAQVRRQLEALRGPCVLEPRASLGGGPQSEPQDPGSSAHGSDGSGPDGAGASGDDGSGLAAAVARLSSLRSVLHQLQAVGLGAGPGPGAGPPGPSSGGSLTSGPLRRGLPGSASFLGSAETVSLPPLNLPEPSAAPKWQLEVAPGGHVVLHQPAQQPPLQPCASAPASAGGSTAAGGSELLSRAAQQAEGLAASLAQCRQRWSEACSIMDQYSVLCEVLSERLDVLVGQLAERDNMVAALSNKVSKTIAAMAEQDNQIADKDSIINALQTHVRASSDGGWRHLPTAHSGGSTSSAAAGAGGGGAAGPARSGAQPCHLPTGAAGASPTSTHPHPHSHHQPQQHQQLPYQPPAGPAGSGGSGRFVSPLRQLSSMASSAAAGAAGAAGAAADGGWLMKRLKGLKGFGKESEQE